MNRLRIWATALVMLGFIAFWPNHAQSRQYFDATMRFDPIAGTGWHYATLVQLDGMEIWRQHRNTVGGIIAAIYDENITSSGGGLVSATVSFNTYDSFNLGSDYQFENPTGGPMAPPDYGSPSPGEPSGFSSGGNTTFKWRADPFQSIGGGEPGGGGGGIGGGGGGGTDLLGEGQFEITPVLETDINYTMSESGRLLDLSGLELIGEVIDPSRSITVRQVFQTNHFVVLPDYQVHINETWRAPMSWTIPFVGETLEIPMTFRLADIKTSFRFRVAAVDFNGILQFDVDVADEGQVRNADTGLLEDMRKESNIKGDIIIQGRAYIDLDRGILVALCDNPAWGDTGFADSDRRLPWELTPGFFAQLNFERRDLYTPLGNVVDRRQEVLYRIQELEWYTTTMVE